MIERLAQALKHLEELPEDAQRELAEQIEEMADLLTSGDTRDLPQQFEIEKSQGDANLPKRVRDALAIAGVARDLQRDDEFEALQRIRHESVPTPGIESDDL